jgi:uncharacterized SAM-binding protein YcdF (DUF218 family)
VDAIATPSQEKADRRMRDNIPIRRAAEGFCLGALIGLGCSQLGFGTLLQIEDVFILPSLLGAGIALTRARTSLHLAAGIVLFGLLIIGYTPLVRFLMPTVIRQDPIHPAPAIVILSSTVHKDQSLSVRAQERIIEGYALLRQGYSPLLVLTRATTPFGPQTPAVRRQMELLGLRYPIQEVGPVQDTHDEALAVARLARERGWNEVILVTHPWHMRRAAAAFEKAGLSVVCAPCVEGEYDLHAYTPPDRLRAFRDWLHESVGYQIYRWRGWIAKS